MLSFDVQHLPCILLHTIAYQPAPAPGRSVRRKHTSFSQLRATPKTPATHPSVGGPENAQALETGFAFGSDRDFAGRALPLCNLYLATSGLPTECTNQNSLPNRRLPHPHPLPPPCLYPCHQRPTSIALSINSVSPIVAMSLPHGTRPAGNVTGNSDQLSLDLQALLSKLSLLLPRCQCHWPGRYLHPVQMLGHICAATTRGPR